MQKQREKAAKLLLAALSLSWQAGNDNEWERVAGAGGGGSVRCCATKQQQQGRKTGRQDRQTDRKRSTKLNWKMKAKQKAWGVGRGRGRFELFLPVRWLSVVSVGEKRRERGRTVQAGGNGINIISGNSWVAASAAGKLGQQRDWERERLRQLVSLLTLALLIFLFSVFFKCFAVMHLLWLDSRIKAALQRALGLDYARKCA